MCPDESALPTEALTEPLHYELDNNCLAGSSDPHANTVWHWGCIQVRGVTMEHLIVLSPIEGTLSPGESASDGFDQVRLCPDDPPPN